MEEDLIIVNKIDNPDEMYAVVSVSGNQVDVYPLFTGSGNAIKTMFVSDLEVFIVEQAFFKTNKHCIIINSYILAFDALIVLVDVFLFKNYLGGLLMVFVSMIPTYYIKKYLNERNTFKEAFALCRELIQKALDNEK